MAVFGANMPRPQERLAVLAVSVRRQGCTSRLQHNLLKPGRSKTWPKSDPISCQTFDQQHLANKPGQKPSQENRIGKANLRPVLQQKQHPTVEKHDQACGGTCAVAVCACNCGGDCGCCHVRSQYHDYVLLLLILLWWLLPILLLQLFVHIIATIASTISISTVNTEVVFDTVSKIIIRMTVITTVASSDSSSSVVVVFVFCFFSCLRLSPLPLLLLFHFLFLLFFCSCFCSCFCFSCCLVCLKADRAVCPRPRTDQTQSLTKRCPTQTPAHLNPEQLPDRTCRTTRR